MAAEGLVLRAVVAAQEVACAHALDCGEAVVLPGGANVTVHLRPAPVVAKVMTGTAFLHPDPERWLAAEVAVGAFLSARGLGVGPSAELPPGPFCRDGLWMTFWALVELDPLAPPPDARELGGSLRALHAALAEFPGELPPLRGVREWLELVLDGLRPPAGGAGAQELRGRLRLLAPAVFESALPVQPVHGDAGISNLLRTRGGLLWSDFEDACVGPVHWDLAGVVEGMLARGDSEREVTRLLGAYGSLEPGELSDFIEAHRLYSAVWRAHLAQGPTGGAPSGG